MYLHSYKHTCTPKKSYPCTVTKWTCFEQNEHFSELCVESKAWDGPKNMQNFVNHCGKGPQIHCTRWTEPSRARSLDSPLWARGWYLGWILYHIYQWIYECRRRTFLQAYWHVWMGTWILPWSRLRSMWTGSSKTNTGMLSFAGITVRTPPSLFATRSFCWCRFASRPRCKSVCLLV